MEIIETLSMSYFSFWLFTSCAFSGVYLLIEEMLKNRNYENCNKSDVEYLKTIVYVVIVVAYIVGFVTFNLYYYLCLASLSANLIYVIYKMEISLQQKYLSFLRLHSIISRKNDKEYSDIVGTIKGEGGELKRNI
jgi:hypothetical protein